MPKYLAIAAIVCGLCVSLAGAQSQADPDTDQKRALQERVNRLEKELEEVKALLAAMQNQPRPSAEKPAPATSPSVQAQAAPAPTPPTPQAVPAAPATRPGSTTPSVSG